MTTDTGALGLVIQAMQDELDAKDRIIARLVDALDTLKGRTLYDLAQMFAPRRRGGQPAFALARAARIRVQ
jgi:hypothetical protein